MCGLKVRKIDIYRNLYLHRPRRRDHENHIKEKNFHSLEATRERRRTAMNIYRDTGTEVTDAFGLRSPETLQSFAGASVS